MTAVGVLDLLEQQADAIRAGDFAQIGALGAHLDAALRHLTERDPRLLYQVRARAERNRQLLGASLAGVRAAQRRIADIVACQSPTLSVAGYSPPKTAAAVGPARLERRS